ncbi:LuxR C-terminal-related transcriptional regulator [Terrabacter aeriphilus]|uniref:LuxR C-terminal-related transcriptional regulator n=1 Tax=Terrabacter aeriphilus TaxID=515662 RepID=UPI0031EEED73
MRTKLFVPRARHALVPRARLLERLQAADTSPLTVVSGPAGFGKTTLLAAWAGATERPVAWVSLEASEQHPTPFWTYVVTALDTAVPGVGATVLPLLQGADARPGAVVATLVNALAAVPGGVDLVLDDYHLADTAAIAGDVAFLVEHLPADVRVLIGTRADPDLPLARMRARGALVEVRAADLRLTRAEVAAYVTDVAGLGLTADEVAALEDRTEGWVAALQLAALSLRGRDDAASFIAGFAGDDRYVVDYLVEEVVRRQPEQVRRFLLDTSVLDRLSGSLCDAVTGGSDSRSVLESLERANLFVVPLDDNRRWYRYHHLFADVLRAHLVEDRPSSVPTLHRRAAQWYAAADEPEPAVRHAITGGDLELAADVVERTAIGLLRQRRESTVRAWIDEIPDALVRQRPVLAIGFIGALMSRGEFDTVPERLARLEALLADPSADVVVLDEHEAARVPGAMETYRAALALVSGDAAGTVMHADLAVERAAPGDDLTVAAASALAGLASWAGGDLESAHRAYSVAVAGLERAGNISDVLGCSITLGDLRTTQGRLDDARRTYEQALRLAAAHAGPGTGGTGGTGGSGGSGATSSSGTPGGPLRGVADMEVGLSGIALETGDLGAAAAHLDRAGALGEHLGLPQFPYRWRVAQARLREAEGDRAGALALLEEAQRVYVGDYSPDVCPLAAQRVRVLLTLGRVDEALEWARERGLTPDDEPSYVREYEHVTLARALLHHPDTSPTAHRLLERLAAAAESGGRTGILVEMLVLQAVALDRASGSGDVGAPLEPLERAVRLAEGTGHVRVFVGEGAPMAGLLAALVEREPAWGHPRRLLDACHREAVVAGGVGDVNEARGLVEPLSTRELEVLRLLATSLDGPDIARRLFISVNTLRTHTKNVYAKLGVNRRRDAVARAGELGLL